MNTKAETWAKGCDSTPKNICQHFWVAITLFTALNLYINGEIDAKAIASENLANLNGINDMKMDFWWIVLVIDSRAENLTITGILSENKNIPTLFFKKNDSLKYLTGKSS